MRKRLKKKLNKKYMHFWQYQHEAALARGCGFATADDALEYFDRNDDYERIKDAIKQRYE